MTCPRCQIEVERRSWCPTCEREFDAWSRKHAGDVIYSVLGAMVVVLTVAMGMPLLGMPMVFATFGIVGGFGALLGIARYNRNRRRQQFLRGAAMPRAYLPEKT